jgi:CpeT/CpcT family (DUF1001)
MPSRSIPQIAHRVKGIGLLLLLIASFELIVGCQSRLKAINQSPVQPAKVQTEESALEDQFAVFLRWFEGEFDNNEQVWQQQQTAEKEGKAIVEPFEHIHHLFVKVDAPNVGEHVYFVRQTFAGDPIRELLDSPKLDSKIGKIYRQRIYRFSTLPSQIAQDGTEKSGQIILEIFSFLDEAEYQDLHLRADQASAMRLDELKATPGCDVQWQFDAVQAAFVGSMKKNACKIVSKSSGKPIFINDKLRLSQTQLDIQDVARDDEGKLVWGRTDEAAHENRKVTYFTGWAAISREPKAQDHTGKYSFQSGIKLHNEGDRVQLKYDDGKPSGYWIELAQLTYQDTKTPILKLALIDELTNKSATYIWANTDATRIGMNLKWIQVGLTQKAADRHLSFERKPK